MLFFNVAYSPSSVSPALCGDIAEIIDLWKNENKAVNFAQNLSENADY